MAHRHPGRSRLSPRVVGLALSVSCAIASSGAVAGCTVTRTANNEITLRFGAECTTDAALQNRVKSDLLGAVSALPAAGAPPGADGGGARGPSGGTPRRNATSLSSFTPNQKRLYALDQVRFERDMWWRRTFTPFAYYGQSSK